jgi:hypothetical protein
MKEARCRECFAESLQDWHSIIVSVLLWAQAQRGINLTYIFDSLFAAPPVTLATLRAANSCFKSLSCRRNKNSHIIIKPIKYETKVGKNRGSSHGRQARLLKCIPG